VLRHRSAHNDGHWRRDRNHAVCSEATLELHVYLSLRAECKITFNPRLCLTLCRQFPQNRSLVLRTRPYRNDRLTTVIRDLYFSGGATSFATRFDRLFIRRNGNSPVTREIPGAMLCLVATAVRYRVLVVSSTLNQGFSSSMLPSMNGTQASENTSTSAQHRLSTSTPVM
jgi:hypothetical protein